MTTLQDVHAVVQAFADIHKLHVDCISSGNVNAEIAIVSDYPGPTEASTKVPMSGYHGTLFWRHVKEQRIGLSQESVYVTNARKDKLGASVSQSTEFISDHELWHRLLLQELGMLPNLKYVLILGAQATLMLTDKTSINNWRASVIPIELRDRCVLSLPTYNPAFVWDKDPTTNELRDLMLPVTFTLDLRKFMRLSRGEYVPHEIEAQVIRTIRDLDDMLHALTHHDGPIGCDIEHWNKQTACIGFATDRTFAYVLPFCDTERSLWTFDEELHIRERLQQFFDIRPKIIGQNFMTDATWLWYKDRLRPPAQYLDCMLAHHYLYSMLPHSLAYMTAQYTWHKFYKDEGMNWFAAGDIEAYWSYNAKDTALQLDIGMNYLIPELKQRKLYDLFMEHVMSMDHELTRATALGLMTDAQQLRLNDIEYSAKLEASKAALAKSIMSAIELDAFKDKHRHRLTTALLNKLHANGLSGDELTDTFERRKKTIDKALDKLTEINLSSTQQLNSLFKLMQLPGAGYTTDKWQFERWMASPGVSQEAKTILQSIAQFRSEQKFYSTYVKVRVDPDGRCRYQYNQTGTRTAPGRMSSTQNMWGTGTNMQNQTHRARAQFIADVDWNLACSDGFERLFICDEYLHGGYDPYVFIYVDGEQAEARYVGWCANITKWIEEFEYARTHPGELDCHRALAARIFNKPYEAIPKSDYLDDGVTPTERFYGKRARHGLNYRMQIATFAERTGISIAQATFVFNAYHADTPELRVWWNELMTAAKHALDHKGVYKLKNAYGRELVLIGKFTKSLTDSIVAYEPQSSVGDWMKYVWRKSHSDPRWPHHKARMVLNVHDASIAIAKQSVAKTCLRIMIDHAETPIIVRDKPMIIPASPMMSVPDERGIHRWSNLMKVKL